MDDQENIPPYFICPISLHIMRDPVTVATGISYDRPSIARWLYDRNTCPVTNKPLADLTLTPNTTLLNLITSWKSLIPVSHPNPPQHERDNVELMETLILTLKSCSYNAASLQLIFESVSDSCIKDLPSEPFEWAVEVLKDDNSKPKATMAAFLFLIKVLPYGNKNRITAVNAGVVEAVIELLIEERDERRKYCEAMLVVLTELCKTAEGRAALTDHPAGIAAVAGKVLRVSTAATERAVRVLGLVCRRVCGGKVVEEMVAVGAVAKLCMVVQVEGSRKVREMARGVLGLHMRTWSKSPCFIYYCLS